MSYIKGMYIKNIYNNKDNGYVVGVMKLRETDLDYSKSSIYFTGNFYDLRVKNNYVMYGELVNHNKYGMQFAVNSYEILLPTKKEELVEFLSSDIFPMGEKTASKIVDKYGEDSLQVILDDPDELSSISGITNIKASRIHDVMENYQSSSKIVMDLTALGFSTKNALSIINKYRDKSYRMIEDNIYRLIDEMDFNFIDIDNIALNSGMSYDDERRVQAIIIHVMLEISFNRGDTYLEIEDIYDGILEYNKNIDRDILANNIISLEDMGRIIIEDDKYYLKEFYDAEDYIAYKLCFLNDLENSKFPDLDDLILSLEKKLGIVYDDIQRKAIRAAINNNLLVITGGPGTGKTTIVNAIVSLIKAIYKASDDDIALLAPTGRAAKKMRDTTGIQASTIHKYLGWDKDKNKFSVNEYCPNKEHYIIVDEVSMLDTILLSSLLKGIKRDIKLILVGDYYQLPSVSQGQVLKDIIDSKVIDVVELEYLYRQNDRSYIPILATEIKDMEVSDSFINKRDDYNFLRVSNEEVIPTVNYIINKAILKGYTDRDIQVLAPMYKSLNGIDNLNKNLQKIFNPPSPKKNELVLSDVIYRVGDKVLQLVNDTENGLSNGDIGYITSITLGKKSLSKRNEITVDYDGVVAVYTPDKFINIRHGYAISIHKAQGSEFPMVIMPIVNNFNRMLYNKLIYTAVTRAKKSLILVGDINAFINGVRNDYVDKRRTTLKEKIISKYDY